MVKFAKERADKTMLQQGKQAEYSKVWKSCRPDSIPGDGTKAARDSCLFSILVVVEQNAGQAFSTKTAFFWKKVETFQQKVKKTVKKLNMECRQVA